jgi:sugar/nucleoside kinase (ribokinase family)
MSGSKPLDVLGVGCNSVDYVYRLPAAPRADSPTAKMRIRSHAVFCGGQTATAMAACAALGLRAGYLGAVGNDDSGRRLRAELEQRGVDVSHLLTRDCASRFAVITVDNQSGERVVLWDRDDRLNLAAADIAPAVIASARLVHVDDEDQEAAIVAATLARAAQVPATSDIERMTGHTAALVSAVSIPIFNQHVLPELTGEADAERALRKVRRSHAGLLCVTLGESGAMLLHGDELIHDEGFEIEAVDTTGAGDVFRAALICSLLRGDTPRTMLRFANAAAAVSCTRAGAMASAPSLADVEDAISGAA